MRTTVEMTLSLVHELDGPELVHALELAVLDLERALLQTPAVDGRQITGLEVTGNWGGLVDVAAIAVDVDADA